MRDQKQYETMTAFPSAEDIADDLIARNGSNHLRPVQTPAPSIDPVDHPANADLIQEWTARACLQNGILPWRKIGHHTVILVPNLDIFQTQKPQLEAKFGKVKAAIADPKRIQTAIQRSADPELVIGSETRSADIDSCRDWNTDRSIKMGLLFLTCFTMAIIYVPNIVVITLCICAVVAAVLGSLMRTAALLAELCIPNRPEDPALPEGKPAPIISVMVPLFHEEHIAEHLCERLMKLNYPRDRLDIMLVIERDDHITMATLARTQLPPWIRAITVPRGSCQTKPRALNYALDFARGEIIGVYDAEDAPHPDQLLCVARRFANTADNVACLQGQLDFYNSRSNWLARCFTIEYATWFRIVLPGLAKLGFVIPLGGTTLFFRRQHLEELGGWDAHNVTEDADLGIRLARRGYITEVIKTVTQEEANARAWPWVKQRSRWIKGYAITYWVHMRRPIQLLKDLGFKRFLGLQVQFGATLLNFILLPMLWSFWFGILGVPHPFMQFIDAQVMIIISVLFLSSEVINIIIAQIATARAGRRSLLIWVPSLHFYFPLAALASYKAIWELFTKPFYWDKTAHGIFLPNDDNHSDEDS